MTEKYYISEKPFFYKLDYDKVWDHLLSFFSLIGFFNKGTYEAENKGNFGAESITVVEWLGARDIDITTSIISHTDFPGEKPEKISISQKPFLVKENDLYICYQYKITENILNQMATKWLSDLKLELIISPFVIKYNNRTEFFVSYDNIVALLKPLQLKVFNNLNFEFKEWNVKLNEIL